MKTKELYFFQFLLLIFQNQTTTRRSFSEFLYKLFSNHDSASYKGGFGRGELISNNHKMKNTNSNWRQSVSISRLPKMLLLGILLVMGSLSFAQTNTSSARMTLDNNVTIRTGLYASYEISIAHFGFTSKQEAETYFSERSVDYIEFDVVDESKVLMNFDLNNPEVANWTLADWKEALANRANNSAPRPLPNF